MCIHLLQTGSWKMDKFDNRANRLFCCKDYLEFKIISDTGQVSSVFEQPAIRVSSDPWCLSAVINSRWRLWEISSLVCTHHAEFIFWPKPKTMSLIYSFCGTWWFDSDQNCTVIYPAGICHWYVFMTTPPCILMHFFILSEGTNRGISNVPARPRLTEEVHNIDCQYSCNHTVSGCHGCHFFTRKSVYISSAVKLALLCPVNYWGGANTKVSEKNFTQQTKRNCFVYFYTSEWREGWVISCVWIKTNIKKWQGCQIKTRTFNWTDIKSVCTGNEGFNFHSIVDKWNFATGNTVCTLLDINKLNIGIFFFAHFCWNGREHGLSG